MTTQMTTETTHPARRIAGIAALLTCALVFDPGRVLPDVHALTDINQRIALHAVLIPLLGAAGVWLVIPKPMVLALCTLMLSVAHSSLTSTDLFAGTLYPIIALAAAAVAIYLYFSRRENS